MVRCARARGKVRRATRSRAADRRRMPLRWRAQRHQRASPSAYGPDAIQVAVTVDDLPAHGPPLPGAESAGCRRNVAGRVRGAQAPGGSRFRQRQVGQRRSGLGGGPAPVGRCWPGSSEITLGRTHPLNSTSLEVYLADIRRDEDILDRVAPRDAWKLFRYPFLQEGDTVDSTGRRAQLPLARGATPSPRSRSTPTTGPTARRTSAARRSTTTTPSVKLTTLHRRARRRAAPRARLHARHGAAQRPPGPPAPPRRRRRQRDRGPPSRPTRPRARTRSGCAPPSRIRSTRSRRSPPGPSARRCPTASRANAASPWSPPSGRAASEQR